MTVFLALYIFTMNTGVSQVALVVKNPPVGAQGWCTGITLGDATGRKVGGGSGWGTHVRPWLTVMYGKNHYNIVISLRLK